MRLLVAAACLACLLPATLAEDDSLHWHDNYADAVREARRTGKPIFLEFRCEP